MKWNNKNPKLVNSTKKYDIERVYYDMVNGIHTKITRYQPFLPQPYQGNPAFPMTETPKFDTVFNPKVVAK